MQLISGKEAFTFRVDSVRRQETIAGFGGASLIKNLDGRLEVVGSDKEERQRAREWADLFLKNPASMK